MSEEHEEAPPTAHGIENTHVRAIEPLVAPVDVKRAIPITGVAVRTVVQGRQHVCRLLDGADSRLLVVVGPCSIHDETAALEYAERLARLADRLADHLCLVMRVYFEKPRTTIGWKGLINDPYLNDTFDIAAGLHKARRLLLQIAEMGLPAATEMLDPITPQYIADLVTWSAIGARTTESQTHRQMASGLSMPVGYKNATDGNLQVAIDAMRAALCPHSFLGIDAEGRTCVVHTKGNPWGHVILRGGRQRKNYDASSLRAAKEALRQAKVRTCLMVDCSHANSEKDFRKQAVVWRDVLAQRLQGESSILGLMLESNLVEGNQSLDGGPENLRYGVSITDACIGWDETEELLTTAHAQLAAAAR